MHLHVYLITNIKSNTIVNVNMRPQSGVSHNYEYFPSNHMELGNLMLHADHNEIKLLKKLDENIYKLNALYIQIDEWY